MTVITLTQLAAQQHIDDLHKKADHSRLVSEARATRRVRLWIPRVFARRVPGTATA